MATLVPPPSKRQKTAATLRAREQQEIASIPTDLGFVRVQFIDQTTGKTTGSTISIPVADSTVPKLEQVVNSLLGNDAADRVPFKFSFHRAIPDTVEGAHIDVTNDLYHTLLEPGLATTENAISLYYTPQAVFRVRAATRCSASISGHGAAILCTQFSPISASRAATGSGDNTAKILDCDTGTPVHTLKGHTDHVLVVQWSQDGSMLATGSKDCTVRIWDTKTGQPLGQPLRGHKKYIRSLAWEPFHIHEPGRPRLASASKDGTVRIYDVISQRIEEVLSGHKDSVSCVAWSGTGKLYTASHDKTVKVWEPSGKLLHTLTGHAHWINHLALSTETVLRTAYHDPMTKFPTDAAEKVAKARQRFEKAATINGVITERLVSASDDNTIILWNPEATLKPVARLMGHQKLVNHVTFSPDGALIASSSFENHVKIWSAYDGKFIYSLRGHVAPVYMSCFAPDSRLLVSASKDTTLKIWDLATGKMKLDLPGSTDQLFAVDWACDGGAVISGGADKMVRIWRH